MILTTGTQCLDECDRQWQDAHHHAIKAGQPPVFGKITIPYKGAQETYYRDCQTQSIHNFGKPRLVINHRRADLSDPAGFYSSNRLHWQAPGMTRIRRHRGPVAVYHAEGKEAGLDPYQVRDFAAIARPVALVAVT